MKMLAPDYLRLKELVQRYPLGISQPAYEIEGLSARRWLFDHLWNIPYAERQNWFDGALGGAPIYSYLDDTHIATALRQIVKELKL